MISMPEVIVTSLIKSFGGVRAIDNVSFSIESGEALALLGPSGCGKSTTLRCIAGLEVPDDGEIIIGGKTVFSKKRGIFVPPNKRNVGMVFQSYALWPHMTVFKNIAYPLEVRKWSKNDIKRRVDELLDMLGLQGLQDRYPHQLSGGQQQRVALARAIAPPDVDVLLLDEPLSNLDAKLRESLRVELRNIQKKLRKTMIYVTHDRIEAFTVADKIGVMNKGKLVAFGKASEIMENPRDTFTADFLGYIRLFDGKVISINDLEAVIDIGDYKIKCKSPSKLEIGDSVSVYVLNLELSRENRGSLNTNYVRASIRGMINLGSVIEYEIDVQGKPMIVKIPLKETNINLNNKDIYLSFNEDITICLKI